MKSSDIDDVTVLTFRFETIFVQYNTSNKMFSVQRWQLGYFVFIALAIGAAVGRKTYPHKGNNCYYCPPGSHRKNHCTDTQQTTCSVCPHGTYVHVENKASKCLDCKESCHVTHQEVVRNCTSSSNIICRCKSGYWLRNRLDPHCMPHRPCFPGHGAVIPGTPFSDVTCKACPLGTFSDEYSKTQKCQPHSKCKNYLYHGNSTHDSNCTVTHSVNSSRPSSGKGDPTVPGNVVDDVDSQESSTITSRGKETRNHTKDTSFPVVLGPVGVALIVIGATVLCAVCCLLGGLCWKYGWLESLLRCCRGESSSEVVPQKDPNGNAMELAETVPADGAGEPRGSGAPEEIVISRNGSAGDGATREPPGLIRRKSSGLQLYKPDYKRSSSRNSDPETTPFLETGVSEVFDQEPSPSPRVFPRRPLGEVKEMKLADFFHKAGDVLHPDNWRSVMRALPGTVLTDLEINNIEYNKRQDGITEMKYQCFVRWHTKNPNADVVKSVLEALDKVVGNTPNELTNVKIIES